MNAPDYRLLDAADALRIAAPKLVGALNDIADDVARMAMLQEFALLDGMLDAGRNLSTAQALRRDHLYVQLWPSRYLPG